MAQTAASLQGDVLPYLEETVLPISQRRMVLHHFGEIKRIPKGRGNNWEATRYNRLPVPAFPLAEGVPSPDSLLTIQKVVGTAQQWGGKGTITDVMELTIFHDTFQQLKRMLAYQIAECFERNDFLTCMGCTQVNFVNMRGARSNLVAGDVLDLFTITRTQVALDANGTPYFGASTEPDIEMSALEGSGRQASSDPWRNEHYVGICPVQVTGDLRQNPTIVNAWSYSDVNKLYNNEVGQLGGVRWCRTNMAPTFTGVANTGINPTAGSSGNLPANTYYVQLTGSDTSLNYESRIYQVSTGIVVASSTGSIAITTPNTPNFTFTAYLGLSASPSNVATVASGGPTTGPMAGMAVQLAPNTTFTLTGFGVSQTPPAAPATGVIVYCSLVFGQGAFAVIELENVEYAFLNRPEKLDPQNQTRVASWKAWNGSMLLNTAWIVRIESTSAFSATYG